MVFVEHREYRPGDDLRLLDWRAYARSDRHQIKRFEQETHLRASLVIDRSGSMAYGGEGRPTKAEHAATLLGALALILVRQGDAAGLSVIDQAVQKRLPPRTRPAHLEEVLVELARPPERGTPTNLHDALTEVAERARRRGLVAIASDLLDFDEAALAPLSHLIGRGHDVVVFQVLDPADRAPVRRHLRASRRARRARRRSTPSRDAARGVPRRVDHFIDACRRRCSAVGARWVLARTDEPAERTLASVLTRGRGRAGAERWASRRRSCSSPSPPRACHSRAPPAAPRPRSASSPTVALLRAVRKTSSRRRCASWISLLLIARVLLVARSPSRSRGPTSPSPSLRRRDRRVGRIVLDDSMSTVARSEPSRRGGRARSPSWRAFRRGARSRSCSAARPTACSCRGATTSTRRAHAALAGFEPDPARGTDVVGAIEHARHGRLAGSAPRGHRLVVLSRSRAARGAHRDARRLGARITFRDDRRRRRDGKRGDRRSPRDARSPPRRTWSRSPSRSGIGRARGALRRAHPRARRRGGRQHHTVELGPEGARDISTRRSTPPTGAVVALEVEDSGRARRSARGADPARRRPRVLVVDGIRTRCAATTEPLRRSRASSSRRARRTDRAAHRRPETPSRRWTSRAPRSWCSPTSRLPSRPPSIGCASATAGGGC
ncbi:MAG: DUF58 domain-containing protein [Sandaracinaceae bacterium]